MGLRKILSFISVETHLKRISSGVMAIKRPVGRASKICVRERPPNEKKIDVLILNLKKLKSL